MITIVQPKDKGALVSPSCSKVARKSLRRWPFASTSTDIQCCSSDSETNFVTQSSFEDLVDESCSSTTTNLGSLPAPSDFALAGGDSQKVTDAQPKKGICALCGIGCRNVCGGCRMVHYCSKKHQQTHWSKHKISCRSFSIPPQYPNGWSSTSTSSSKSSNAPVAFSSLGASSNVRSSLTALAKDKEVVRMELKWMVANKDISGAKTLFSEKPLIIAPNYSALDSKSKSVCLGCYKHFASSLTLDPCSKCLLPLCKDCSMGESQDLNKIYFHSEDECLAFSDANMKNKQIMSSRNEKLGQSMDLVKDYTIFKILMLQKQKPEKWDSFMSLKTNPRYSWSLKFPTDYVKSWVVSNCYIISESYLKHTFKDKSLKLEEVVRIFAVFSDVSYFNSEQRILYILRSWIPHTCSPNAEFHFKKNDPNQTLYVKTVDSIKTDGLISINYIEDYDEGISKSSIRLFNASGLFCANFLCSCRIPGTDGSVGIRCNKISTGTRDTLISCPGYLAPSLNAPNPEKPNLGLLIYIKSKSWNCSKCKRSEKYSVIQKQVKEIVDTMKIEVDDYCQFPEPIKYARLKDQLHAHLSDHHWFNWKVLENTLACWDKITGYGEKMLSYVIGMSEGPSSDKKNFLEIINQKTLMYGSGIEFQVIPKYYPSLTVLNILEKRHGTLSPIRGYYLFDAFYANLIKFAEEFKQKLINLQIAPTKLGEIITETLRCMQILMKMLEETAQSLSLIENNTEDKKHALMALEMLQVFQKVYLQTSKNRASVILYMKEFLELYAAKDTAFLANVLSKFKPVEDELGNFFDSQQSDLDHNYLDLTFGPAGYGTTKSPFGPEDIFIGKEDNYKPSFSGGRKASSAGHSFTSGNSARKEEDTKKKSDTHFLGKNMPKGANAGEDFSDYSSDESFLNKFGDFGDLKFSDESGGSGNDSDIECLDDTINYYETLLNESMKNRMATEKLLRDMFK